MSKNTVRSTRTSKRPKRQVENPDYAEFTRRIVKAYARRVADGDIEALPSMAQLASDVDTALHDAVAGLRTWGYSWAAIATRLGVNRSTAQERFAQPGSGTPPLFDLCEGGQP
jgi:hypothetical protein